MIKTVLELDLVGYGMLARELQSAWGPRAVTDLNRQIQGFVDEALSAVGLPRDETVMVTTGDGAILVFDQAAAAHHFAESLHAAVRAYNIDPEGAGRPGGGGRWFRTGAVTGAIDMQPRPGGGYDIAGEPIGRAVRLETAARPGELLIDCPTYEALPGSARRCYGPEEEVFGKRGECFLVRRYPILLGSPVEAHATTGWRPGDRLSVAEELSRLDPEQLDRLIFLLGLPLDRQPSRSLDPTERKSELLVRWAGQSRERLERLEAELRYLVEKEAYWQSLSDPAPR
jgi:class 3 adenylate cyclase